MSLSAVSQSTPEGRVLIWHEFLASRCENSPLILFVVLFGLAPFIVAREYAIPAGAWMLWRLTGWLLDSPAVQAFLWPEWAGSAAQVAS
jgi:hypothetical protein